MPPTSVLKLLQRLFFPRRNALTEHVPLRPDRLAEARAIRREAEAKLDRTEKVLADTRGELWLVHQRHDKHNNGGKSE